MVFWPGPGSTLSGGTVRYEVITSCNNSMIFRFPGAIDEAQSRAITSFHCLVIAS
jgi:hypothetical protein